MTPRTQALFDLRIIAEGLDQYKLIHGEYPEFSDFKSMIAPNSVLIKENFIPIKNKLTDPWGNPYWGTSSKSSYRLESKGNPKNSEENQPILFQSARLTTRSTRTQPRVFSALSRGCIFPSLSIARLAAGPVNFFR
jgi:hypothetical protein